MHTRWHSLYSGALGFVIGVALVGGGLYVFVHSAPGLSFIRDLLVAQATRQYAGTTLASSSLLYQKSALPIPQSYADYDYFLAINNVINDVALVNNANIELGPVLEQLNEKTLSCNFEGFYDLMGTARSLSNKNLALSTQFAVHLSALASANARAKDALLKSQTQDAVAAGQSLTEALEAYGSEVQSLLFGSTPTSGQLTELSTKVAAASAASQNFGSAFKPLLERILSEDKRLSSATSTPIR